MKAETYLIKYVLIYPDKKVDKEIKVKNCLSELQAKIKLGIYVERHYPKALRIEITSCEIDNLFSQIFPGFKGF